MFLSCNLHFGTQAMQCPLGLDSFCFQTALAFIRLMTSLGGPLGQFARFTCMKLPKVVFGALTMTAKCNSVCKQYATLLDSPVALTSASKYFQILPAHPGALHNALRLPCGYGTLRTTGLRIRNQVYCRPAQRCPQLQHLTILIVKSHSILNAPPSLQVLSRAHENAFAFHRSYWSFL